MRVSLLLTDVEYEIVKAKAIEKGLKPTTFIYSLVYTQVVADEIKKIRSSDTINVFDKKGKNKK
jgi:hypothetical protein